MTSPGNSRLKDKAVFHLTLILHKVRLFSEVVG